MIIWGWKMGRMVQQNVSSVKNRQKFSMKRALKNKAAHYLFGVMSDANLNTKKIALIMKGKAGR